MKLRSKIISGFLLVSVLPMIALAVLLYFYLGVSFRNANIKTDQMAVGAFSLYLENQLGDLEQAGNRLLDSKDFMILTLDQPDKADQLISLLESRMAADDYQFLMIQLERQDRMVRVFRDDVRAEFRTVSFPVLADQEQYSSSGLISLGARNQEVVAGVVLIPIFHKGEYIGRLLAGSTLDQLVAGYPLQLYGLSGLIVSATDRVVYARNDQLLSDYLSQLSGTEIDVEAAEIEIADHEFFVRKSSLAGLAGDSLAAATFVFDLEERSAAQRRLLRLFLILVGATAGLAIVVGFVLSRHLSRPVSEMAAAARKIADGEVPERIIYFDQDEIGDLVSGINRLTDDLRETEVKLRRSEQIAAWQTFARQMAHELRNFFMPLNTTVSRLARWSEIEQVDRAQLAEVAGDLNRELGRMKHLLASFSEFARLPGPTPKATTADEILTPIRSAFAGQLREGMLAVVVAEDTGALTCDSGQIAQVLLNLIANSFEAGATVVELRVTEEQDTIVFEVIDDGKGVAPGADPFAPMYSTKEHGSGLGLAIARRIIVDHGGDISYSPNQTGGSVFRFHLPRDKR
jgi:signal transduction histidine kinase